MYNELATDVLIVGGGVGGCAAALAACSAGLHCIVVEETDWIGGQLTAQAVPPDEHGWIERFGCTRRYRQFRDSIRRFYRDNYPLTNESQALQHLNPGKGWVSPLCHEPRVAVSVLEAMLTSQVSSGRLKVLKQYRAIGAESDSPDKITAVIIESAILGKQIAVSARLFIDATELGDLLTLCGVENVTGAESHHDTGEPHAASVANPSNSQAFTWCAAVGYSEHGDEAIHKPEHYDFWRIYAPQLRPAWSGRLFSWTVSNPRTLAPRDLRFAPDAESGRAFEGLWSYRRVLARSHFTPGSMASDISILNWPMMDYVLGDVCTSDPETRQLHFDRAKELTQSFLYWLKTEAPRPDGGTGHLGLCLRGDAVGTDDGLAKSAYIRESRRIRAEFTVCEQHLSVEARAGRTRAQFFADSVGVGFYRIDLHPTSGGDNYLDIPALPFQIPLGALIPCRVENLLPAAKNIGVTHITNGCFRVHPVEWNVGEVAGELAAYCLSHNISPRGVLRTSSHLSDFQNRLCVQGVELEWPNDISLDQGNPHVHAM